ncbi:hypothetical protein GCM10023205_52480 [Yinghuangia aomiensis]|uniref:HNH endonuclease n=1 Tax=Yinghuangia aomiensis TaxID=676205 RepID=A0ABP9HTV1_9ACTN
MPIRPENQDRYPTNWPQISFAIREERARWRCECVGQCLTGHFTRCEAHQGRPHPRTGTNVVLTVAHLDHTPENCDPDNLRAMCQACHLAYDTTHHQLTRAEVRHRNLADAGQTSLLELL